MVAVNIPLILRHQHLLDDRSSTDLFNINGFIMLFPITTARITGYRLAKTLDVKKRWQTSTELSSNVFLA